MTQNSEKIPFSTLINKPNYNIGSLDSEIKADRYCAQLLKYFHLWLREEQQYEGLEAGKLAAGADYFLREFSIGARRENIFDITSALLNQFGGNWYIINNLEPNIAELEPMLRGTVQFCIYCSDLNLMTAENTEAIRKVAAQIDYFRTRIDTFHQLQDDGYSAWKQACPLK